MTPRRMERTASRERMAMAAMSELETLVEVTGELELSEVLGNVAEEETAAEDDSDNEEEVELEIEVEWAVIEEVTEMTEGEAWLDDVEGGLELVTDLSGGEEAVVIEVCEVEEVLVGELLLIIVVAGGIPSITMVSVTNIDTVRLYCIKKKKRLAWDTKKRLHVVA